MGGDRLERYTFEPGISLARMTSAGIVLGRARSREVLRVDAQGRTKTLVPGVPLEEQKPLLLLDRKVAKRQRYLSDADHDHILLVRSLFPGDRYELCSAETGELLRTIDLPEDYSTPDWTVVFGGGIFAFSRQVSEPGDPVTVAWWSDGSEVRVLSTCPGDTGRRRQQVSRSSNTIHWLDQRVEVHEHRERFERGIRLVEQTVTHHPHLCSWELGTSEVRRRSLEKAPRIITTDGAIPWGVVEDTASLEQPFFIAQFDEVGRWASTIPLDRLRVDDLRVVGSSAFVIESGYLHPPTPSRLLRIDLATRERELLATSELGRFDLLAATGTDVWWLDRPEELAPADRAVLCRLRR